MAEIACRPSNGLPKWGLIDLFRWKLLPSRIGGGKEYIQKFKDAWVSHNKLRIRTAAALYKLPPELLAGVCWIEVGGDPNFIDRIAFEIRALDWSGPPATDKMAITKNPALTSFGSVSIQLRTAAQTLGMNPADMSASQLRSLAQCMQQDVFNIDTVARHLRELADHDQFSAPLTSEQIRIIGARYNRGMGLSLDKIKQNTAYGNFIVKHWPRFSRLIQ